MRGTHVNKSTIDIMNKIMYNLVIYYTSRSAAAVEKAKKSSSLAYTSKRMQFYRRNKQHHQVVTEKNKQIDTHSKYTETLLHMPAEG